MTTTMTTDLNTSDSDNPCGVSNPDGLADYGYDSSSREGYNYPYYCPLCNTHAGDAPSSKSVPLRKDAVCYICSKPFIDDLS